MQTFTRILVFVAVAYLAVLVILSALQSRFLYPAPQNVAPPSPDCQEITLETGDGLNLRAFYREAAEGLPTLIYFHGNGGTLSGAQISNAPLVAGGLGVLLVEYRGYGGNPGKPSEQGFYLDGEAGIDWLADQGIAASDLIVIGNSIGGGVAVEMALRHEPAGLILIAPFTSLPDAAAANLWWLPARSLVRDQYANASKIGQLSMPVLIQHGTADNLIPQSQGRALAELAPNAEFQSFVGSGHALSFEPRSGAARREWIMNLRRGQASP